MERLHQTHSSLKAYRPPAASSVESILGRDPGPAELSGFVAAVLYPQSQGAPRMLVADPLAYDLECLPGKLEWTIVDRPARSVGSGESISPVREWTSQAINKTGIAFPRSGELIPKNVTVAEARPSLNLSPLTRTEDVPSTAGRVQMAFSPIATSIPAISPQPMASRMPRPAQQSRRLYPSGHAGIGTPGGYAAADGRRPASAELGSSKLRFRRARAPNRPSLPRLMRRIRLRLRRSRYSQNSNWRPLFALRYWLGPWSYLERRNPRFRPRHRRHPPSRRSRPSCYRSRWRSHGVNRDSPNPDRRWAAAAAIQSSSAWAARTARNLARPSFRRRPPTFCFPRSFRKSRLRRWPCMPSRPVSPNR